MPKKNIVVTTVILIISVVLALVIIIPDDESNQNRIDDSNEINVNEDRIEIKFLGGNEVNIDTEVADNPAKRSFGLMNREELGEKEGMIFIFNNEQELSFWMKNTLIPLDIIFINEQKEIISIHKNTEPENVEKRYNSNGKALYAIEVNGGFTDIHGISEGDKIDF